MKTLVVIGFGILFLLSGCTKQVGNGRLVTIKIANSFYSIPSGKQYSSVPLSYKIAKKMNAVGVPCRKKDIIWMTSAVKRNIDNNKQMNIRAIYRNGLIGCAHPRNKPPSSTTAYQRKRIYTCSQLTKTQAYALLRAGHTYLDKDHDGHPCEWGRKKVRKRYYPTYRSNCHYVRGYYRRSGTYVRGYTRCR